MMDVIDEEYNGHLGFGDILVNGRVEWVHHWLGAEVTQMIVCPLPLFPHTF